MNNPNEYTIVTEINDAVSLKQKVLSTRGSINKHREQIFLFFVLLTRQAFLSKVMILAIQKQFLTYF